MDYVASKSLTNELIKLVIITIKKYLQVTKPGIIFGNLVAVIGGFLLASRGKIDYILLVITSMGISLVIASSCVLNNIIDRDIDKKMKRTEGRVLAQNLISNQSSIIYATLLSIIGFILLNYTNNSMIIWLTIIGFTIYVSAYSLFMKRNSIYGTLVGSISGSIPPVVGYCAASNQFDSGAIILFFTFCLWQIPHSYSIAIFRFKDYQAAKIPILPIKIGISKTKHYIVIYIIGFILSMSMLNIMGYTGYIYLTIMILVSFCWLGISLCGYRSENNDKEWARVLFITSILIITILSFTISIDFISPIK